MSRKDSPQKRGSSRPTEEFIYIIGPRSFQNELMLFFLQQKTGANVGAVEDSNHIQHQHAKKIPQPTLFLCDCLEKNLDTCLLELGSNDKKILYDHYIALFNISPGLGIEEKALRKGIRGFFYEQDHPEQLLKGIQAIFNGELWASREIMTKSILENRDKDIVNRKDQATLTQREIEILTMMAVGAKNEQIADSLFISPNTVKTHIYNIFKKINVPNRLQAALWAAKNL